MNKAELVDAISQQTETSRSESERFLEAFIGIVSDTMAKTDDGVRLVGFGTFKAAERKEAIRNNPQTGEKLVIPAKCVPVFRAGKALKQHIATKKVKA